jgi:hypothetical protein
VRRTRHAPPPRHLSRPHLPKAPCAFPRSLKSAPPMCRFRTCRRPRHCWTAPPAASSPVRALLPRPPYHGKMPSVSSTRSKRPAAYKSQSYSSRVPSRPVQPPVRRRPPLPPLGELRHLLQPRSTDPSGTPSRLRRGSSSHPSPRIAPPLVGL